MIAVEEQTVLESINLDLPWGLIERFTILRREHPEDVRTAAKEITSRLEAHGVPVEVLEPEIFLSLPGKASVTLGQNSYNAKPMAMSLSSEGLTAPLVYMLSMYARSSTDVFDRVAFAEELDCRGKIVVSEGYGMPGKVADLEARGAVGLIAVNAGKNAHWGICTTIWGSPDLHDLPRKPKMVVVAVNNPDGQALIEAAKKGEFVKLEANLEEGWFASPIPVVTIPGSEEPDKFVLLHGHYDSWDYGIGDNAVGDATMLEIARVLWQHRDSLKRSVKIAWWPGHSTGRYAGSTWFADQFAIDLYENCIAQVNCDSPGCRWATTFTELCSMSETEGFISEVIHDIAGADTLVECERAHQAGDYSFNNIGISSYLMLSSTMPADLREEKGYYAVGGCGGNIAWHTEDDTIEIADREVLLRDMKIYLAAVRRAANATIAPFDFAHTLADFRKTLEARQAAAGELFSFQAARDALAGLEAALEQFSVHAQNLKGKSASDGDVKRVNHAIRRLARLLVPVNYTRGIGFFHDPAETIAPLPDLEPALEIANVAPEQRGFYRTHLTRGQNRLVATLRDATATLMDAV